MCLVSVFVCLFVCLAIYLCIAFLLLVKLWVHCFPMLLSLALFSVHHFLVSYAPSVVLPWEMSFFSFSHLCFDFSKFSSVSGSVY